jgi:putative SOS response-associated peptidase YedK
MCGRYTLHHPEEVLAAYFGVSASGMQERYSLAPTELVPFIFHNASEQRQLGKARWGLVPSWSKEGTTRTPLFNVRSETVLEKPAFKSAFIRGRCLVPASGYFEWLKTGDGHKQPYYLKSKSDEPLAFAGLFDVWRSEDGSKRLVSCSILTTAAHEGLSWLHERMPVVLSYDDFDMWLDRSTPDVADLTELLVPYAADDLDIYRVSRQVNSAKVDGPSLIEPLSAPPLEGTRT